MISTDRTVTETIVNALRANATLFGFDDIDGNIRDFLIEHEVPEQRSNFLIADVLGVARVRAFSVFTTSTDSIVALTSGPDNSIIDRVYTTEIRIYEELGINGAGARQLLQLDSIARGIILRLGSTLRLVIDAVQPIQSPRLSVLNGLERDLIMLSRIYSFRKTNPDYETEILHD